MILLYLLKSVSDEIGVVKNVVYRNYICDMMNLCLPETFPYSRQSLILCHEILYGFEKLTRSVSLIIKFVVFIQCLIPLEIFIYILKVNKQQLKREVVVLLANTKFEFNVVSVISKRKLLRY